MINAKPRFGLEGERLFDYANSRYIDATGVFQEHAGEWDLAYVAELLRAGGTIEAAFTSQEAMERMQLMQDSHRKQIHAANAENAELRKRSSAAPKVDKVEQANKDFMADPLPAETPAVSVAPGQPSGEPAATSAETQPPA